VKISQLRDDQLRHAIQCGDCKMDGQAEIVLCGKGEQMGDSKRSLRDELARRDREKHGATS
jgi:hypothetical protein